MKNLAKKPYSTKLSQVLKRYVNYIHSSFGFDSRSISLFRIGLGLTLLVNWSMRVQDAFVHYASDGVLVQRHIRGFENIHLGSLFHVFGSEWGVVLIFALSLISFLAFTIGYRTKLFLVLSLIFLASFHNRFYFGNHSGDMLVRVIMVWAFFMPLSRHYSIDALRGRGLQKPSQILNVLTIGYLLQLSLIYYTAYISKAGSIWRSTSLALEYVFNAGYITRDLGRFLLNYPDLLGLMTPIAYAIEFMLPILILSFLFVKVSRYLAIILAVLLHVGIALTLRVGIFPMISIIAMLPLLPSNFWNNFENMKIRSVEKVVERARTYLVKKQSKSKYKKARFIQVLDSFTKRTARIRRYSFHLVAVLITAMVVNLNLAAYHPSIKSHHRIQQAAGYLHLGQGWGVFSDPALGDLWLVTEAVSASGEAVDPWKYYWSNGKAYDIDLDNLELSKDEYINSTWTKYYESLVNLTNGNEDIHISFGVYMCRNWNDSNPDNLIDSLRLYYAGNWNNFNHETGLIEASEPNALVLADNIECE